MPRVTDTVGQYAFWIKRNLYGSNSLIEAKPFGGLAVWRGRVAHRAVWWFGDLTGVAWKAWVCSAWTRAMLTLWRNETLVSIIIG